MTNKEIRDAMAQYDVRQWQVADKMGISEQSLCRWLRHELSEEKKLAALEAIQAICNARETEGN